MAFAHVQSDENNESASLTTIAITLTGVVAGRLIVVGVRNEGGDGTTSVSDGTTTFVAKTAKNNGSGTMGQQFYLLSSVASGTVTYTATFTAGARTWRDIVVSEFSYTGTAAFDTSPAGDGAIGNSASPASGTFTTTGTDEVVIGHVVTQGTGTGSAHQVNGVAATGTFASAFSFQWWRILTATFTGGQATATISASQDWSCGAIAIKIAGGGDLSVSSIGEPVIGGSTF